MDGNGKCESPDSSAQSKSPRTLRNSMHGNRETSGASAPETAADRRGKAASHTTRVHAPGGAGRGVGPNRRPDNEAPTNAGGAAGRAPNKEKRNPAPAHP